MNSNFNCSIVLSCLFLMAATGWAAESKTDQNPKIISTTWEKLAETLPTEDLLTGSYKGFGLTTGSEYRLHLFQYLNREGAFMAVMENAESNLTGLGMVKRDSQGVYSWQGLRIDPGTHSVDVPMGSSPLMRLQVAVDDSGRVEKIQAVSTHAEMKLEAIDFKEARAPMYRTRALPGSYRRQDNSRLVLTGGDDQLAIQYLAVEEKTGATSSTNYMARKELPGVYAARVSEAKGYQDDTADAVSLVVVPLDIELGCIIKNFKPRLLVFAVDAQGFLSSWLNSYQRN